MYTAVHGRVVLSNEAYLALRETSTQEWIEPQAPAEEAAVAFHSDGTVSIDFAGSSYRNLSRYLLTDLVKAQQKGRVQGRLTLDCSDGCHERTVAEYRGDHVVLGDTVCFHSPVTAQRAELQDLSGGVLKLNGVALTDIPELCLLVPVPGTKAEPLEGAPTNYWCACGGRDEEAEMPICLNKADQGIL